MKMAAHVLEIEIILTLAFPGGRISILIPFGFFLLK